MIEALLTASQLAEKLGFAAGTIVDWAEAGKVPALKIGGRLRFRESEVLDWLEAHRTGCLTETRVLCRMPRLHTAPHGQGGASDDGNAR